MDVAIRMAVAGDFEALMRLERGCDGAPHWSDAVWASLLGVGDEGLRCVMVAEDVTGVAGFLVLGGAGETAELESVVVEAGRRSQGIGRMLCRAAMRWAAGRGAKTMELEVRAGNTARDLYASLGFVEEGVRRRYYLDPVEDAVLMSLELET